MFRESLWWQWFNGLADASLEEMLWARPGVPAMEPNTYSWR